MTTFIGEKDQCSPDAPQKFAHTVGGTVPLPPGEPVGYFIGERDHLIASGEATLGQPLHKFASALKPHVSPADKVAAAGVLMDLNHAHVMYTSEDKELIRKAMYEILNS